MKSKNSFGGCTEGSQKGQATWWGIRLLPANATQESKAFKFGDGVKLKYGLAHLSGWQRSQRRELQCPFMNAPLVSGSTPGEACCPSLPLSQE